MAKAEELPDWVHQPSAEDIPGKTLLSKPMYAVIFTVLKRLGLQGQDWEDEAQDVAVYLLEKGYEGVPAGVVGTSPLTHVIRVCNRRTVTHKRRYVRALRRFDASPEALELMHDDDPSPSQILARAQLAQELDKGLVELPLNFRTALVMHDLYGLTNKQISDDLGWPVGTVDSRVKRARKAMATRFAHLAPDKRTSEKQAPEGEARPKEAARPKKGGVA